MSAPLKDPLTVNTQDGRCWRLRAWSQDGHGLYALADSTDVVPSLRSIRELAEFGLASMTDALPMPVGDGLSEVERLRVRVAELEALTPAAIQTCRKCGAGYTYGEPCSTCAFRARMAAEQQALRERPGEFDAVLHHAYTTPHDLPETGGAR